MATAATKFEPLHARPATRGFSFVELLFAVAVLGIGFIMLAAVFPVGLQQTKLNMDETTGAALGRTMAGRLQQLGAGAIRFGTGINDTYSPLPSTYAHVTTAMPTDGVHYRGTVRTFNDPRDPVNSNRDGNGVVLSAAQLKQRRDNTWRSLADDLVTPGDPRNAVAVMYRRDATGATDSTNAKLFRGDAAAQVIVVNAQVSNAPEYTSADTSLNTTGGAGRAIFNLEPRPVAVQVVYDPSTDNYVASFFSVTELKDRAGYPTGNSPSKDSANAAVSWDSILNAAVNSVGEGAYFVISDDRITNTVTVPATSTTPSYTKPLGGSLNGRSFRIGARRTDLAGLTYDLAPGYGYTPDPGGDGRLNVSGLSSKDDLTAIGVDKNADKNLRSNIVYATGLDVMTPFGTNGADGTDVRVDGAAAEQGAVALVLGRGFSDPVNTPPTSSSYSGPVQDVSLYTTFVTVENQ